MLTGTGLDLDKVTKNLGISSSKAYLNSMFPNEFEYYMLTLELRRNGLVEDTLIFPVTPDSFYETTQHLVNIKKTNNSVVSLINTSFAPRTIQISGTFGRKIRILFGKQSTIENENNSFAGFKFSKDININKKVFGKGIKIDTGLSGGIKTGFGVTKYLESIINKSFSSAGYMLFLYNPMLGNNYLVECTDKTFSQSMQNNMLWNYQLTFKALTFAENVALQTNADREKQTMSENLKFNVINETTNHLVTNIKTTMQSYLKRSIL